MELVIASKNVHKIRELRELLKLFKHIDVLSLLHFPLYEPLPEIGNTLQEISTKKAEHAAKTLQKWVLADDSALFVPALGGAPGIKSRRYAGEDATDTENRLKLLREMVEMTDEKRSAYFECCLALAAPEGLIKCVAAKCEGIVTAEERGRNGFGYDPVFVKYDYDKTFGEIDELTKNRISHRRKAFEKLSMTFENL